VPAMWVGLGLAMRAKSGKSRIHHRSIRNPSRAVKRGERAVACVTGGSRMEEAINFTARFIMEPPSIIVAGYARARARRPELRAIINSEKLLIAIMSSFTETAGSRGRAYLIIRDSPIEDPRCKIACLIRARDVIEITFKLDADTEVLHRRRDSVISRIPELHANAVCTRENRGGRGEK